ncbi:DUF3987 domain-containing protein [Natronogracilivirga saccharolytica]|uniref:DUF3987 domain-containing protein n=1 Tax=Natronogracilivirga saccharolytica TaxID=2812953 RepID=A0A8J7UXZ8_9BACT|nr:DUF3987 domain-containing protein [Natronogracilivirga saccharolytica]MBP3193899.1 DUF3987 domain-containing protein [Natronogracilivirga saccharolytica]
MNNTNTAGKKADTAENARTAENVTIIREVGEATALPENIYYKLPDGLRQMCFAITNRNQRDVFFLAALSVLSAHMKNIDILHSTGIIHPQLFVMIIAPPASGKGIASKAKKLGEPLQDELYKQAAVENKGLNTASADNKARSDKPWQKAFFIPANSSDRAFFDRLHENSGRGLVIETEIDTLLNAMDKEWGNYSDVLLKGFQHETVSINRKEDCLYIEKPNFSICLTGTPVQFNRMFKNPENGLLSRFGLYTFEGDTEWQSHAPKRVGTSLDTEVRKNAKMFYKIFTELDKLSSPLDFQLSTEYWSSLDSVFKAINNKIRDYGLPDLLLSSNRRAPYHVLRIACALAVYRHFEKGEDIFPGMRVIPENDDIDVGVELSKMFVNHTNQMIGFLPRSNNLSNKSQRYREFYEALPGEFTTREAQEIASELGVPERTCDGWLSNYMADFKNIKHGHYRKRK